MPTGVPKPGFFNSGRPWLRAEGSGLNRVAVLHVFNRADVRLATWVPGGVGRREAQHGVRGARPLSSTTFCAGRHPPLPERSALHISTRWLVSVLHGRSERTANLRPHLYMYMHSAKHLGYLAASQGGRPSTGFSARAWPRSPPSSCSSPTGTSRALTWRGAFVCHSPEEEEDRICDLSAWAEFTAHALGGTFMV